MPYYTGNMGWIGGLTMLVVMVAFIAALATVAIVLLRKYGRPALPHDDALRILNERFARGEIDQEEYEHRRSALQR